MIVPSMGMDLKVTEEGFSNTSNVFIVNSFSKEKNSFTVFYSATNNIGVVYSRSFNKNYGCYVVGNKNVVEKANYCGLGFTKNLEKASLFVETGSSFNEWQPGLYVGVFIPFTFKY